MRNNERNSNGEENRDTHIHVLKAKCNIDNVLVSRERERFDSATAHLAQAPLLDPYRYWNNDGFLKPGATPPNIEGKAPLAYSPRARYQNRTRPARTALRASLGLHVNMVIIEVGVQGFIPRQTTRAINSFLKPLMSSAVSTKSLQCHLIATAHDTVKKVARILRARQQAQ